MNCRRARFSIFPLFSLAIFPQSNYYHANERDIFTRAGHGEVSAVYLSRARPSIVTLAAFSPHSRFYFSHTSFAYQEGDDAPRLLLARVDVAMLFQAFSEKHA